MRTSSLYLTVLGLLLAACTFQTPQEKLSSKWSKSKAIAEARSAIRQRNYFVYGIGGIVCPDSKEIEINGQKREVPMKLLHCGCEINEETNAQLSYAGFFNEYMLRHGFKQWQ